MDIQRPSVTSRLLALQIGPFYLFLVTITLSQMTRTSFAKTCVGVFAGATVICVTLCVFGLKLLNHQEGDSRFRLSTAFLVVIPISIYLTGLRHVFLKLPTRDLDVLGWSTVILFSILFIIVSTCVLLWTAEAILWLAVIALRLVRRIARR